MFYSVKDWLKFKPIKNNNNNLPEESQESLRAEKRINESRKELGRAESSSKEGMRRAMGRVKEG